MYDQASELRKLVLQSMRENTAMFGPPPRLIAFTAGIAGAGASTLAVNVSIALAELGSRVVVVDADPHHADIAKLCGLNVPSTSGDVTGARRDIHEVMLRGPGGIQIVPSLWGSACGGDPSDFGQERLFRQFKSLGRHADIVVLDIGTGDTEFLRRSCRLADDVVLVTTAEPESIMDSYACIKMVVADYEPICCRLVVNQCSDQRLAEDVFARVEQSCRRFLNQQLDFLGHVPCDDQVRVASKRARPFLLDQHDQPAALAVQRVAMLLSGREGKAQRSLPAAA
jgi:flagellar biosynthesis protein FlhG